MKVIRVFTYPFCDDLIMDGLCDSAAKQLVDKLNANCNSRSPFWHMAVPDDFKLYCN